MELLFGLIYIVSEMDAECHFHNQFFFSVDM